MSEWREVTLNELGLLQRGKSKHRPRYAFHLYGGPYPFIQTGEIKNANKYIREYTATYSEDGLKQSKLWKKGTLCITIAANIAEIAILDFDACFPDSVIGFVPDEAKADLDFVYYLLQYFQRELKHYGEGSVQDNINLGTFQDVKFPVPELATQRAVAAVLSSLDDKIELLQRQNKTLESLAQALFRHWFVDGEWGEWGEGCLGDLIELAYGKGLKSALRSGEGYPVVGSSGIVDFHSEYLVEAPGIVIGRKGTLGEVIYLSQNFFPIDTTYYVQSKSHSPSLYFEYFLLKSINFKDMNTDSAVPGLNRNIALATEVTVPPQSEIARFNEFVHPFFDKIQKNCIQIRTLERLRDTLLPKLMSGEVRVRLQGAASNGKL